MIVVIGPSDRRIESNLVVTRGGGYEMQEGLTKTSWHLDVNERAVRACWRNFARLSVVDKRQYLGELNRKWRNILACPKESRAFGEYLRQKGVIDSRSADLRGADGRFAQAIIEHKKGAADTGEIVWYAEAVDYLGHKIEVNAEAPFSWLEKVALYAVTEAVDRFPLIEGE